MEEKKASLIHYGLVAFFCLAFRFIPPIGQMTPVGMGVLGCFIGAVYGWSTINLAEYYGDGGNWFMHWHG